MLFEEFGDFFQQIPTILIFYVCIPLFGIGFGMVWYGWIKPRRNKTDEAEAISTTSSSIPMPEITYPSPSETVATDYTDYDDDMDMDLMEMPDLNMLVNHTPEPQPIQKPIVPAPAPQAKPQPQVFNQPIQKGTKYPVKLNTGTVIQSEEIVSVLRDPRDGHLVVYIDDVGYRSLVDSPDVKSRFVQIMKELSNVVTQPDDSDFPESETPPVEEAESVQVSPPQPIINSAPPPPINQEGDMPGDLPSFKLDDAEPEQVKKGRFGRVKMEYKPVPELDIASAIEAYLQHKLQHSPDYNGRNIHVHSSPTGGVLIQVDNQHYEAVSDVEDPQIRAFLSATIQEWQDRQ